MLHTKVRQESILAVICGNKLDKIGLVVFGEYGFDIVAISHYASI